MRVHVTFGRTRHARFDGPPVSVLLALAMVLAFALSLSATLTAAFGRLDSATVKWLVGGLFAQ
jgi:hypothetical protein